MEKPRERDATILDGRGNRGERREKIIGWVEGSSEGEMRSRERDLGEEEGYPELGEVA